MKNKTKITALMLGILFVGIMIGFLVSGLNDPTHKMVEDASTYVSLIISGIALIIALITYYSIEAVDRKNKMDNNVLEMSNYNVSYPQIIKKLNVVDEKTYGEMLRQLVVNKRSIRSCMQFADWIQDIIDHLIWFAYFSKDMGWDGNAKDAFVKSLWDEFDHYDDVSSGVKLLLQENIKLIENVLLYQTRRVDGTYALSSLEDVRHTLVPNPIAKIVYYDYLGLDYRKYTSGLMREIVDQREFSKEYFMTWKSVESFERNEMCFWIEKAIQCFQNAEEIAKDDMLWLGYLKYNLVRCKIMGYLIADQRTEEQLQDIKMGLQECVRIRNNNCLLIKESGFLKQKFEEEYDRAVELNKSFCEVYV